MGQIVGERDQSLSVFFHVFLLVGQDGAEQFVYVLLSAQVFRTFVRSNVRGDAAFRNDAFGQFMPARHSRSFPPFFYLFAKSIELFLGSASQRDPVLLRIRGYLP